ncbi:MAG: hypothetical protein RR248_02840 [Clostridia bacterium]
MSFLDNNKASCTEKICIEVKRVFDACVKQLTYLDVVVDIITSGTPTEPLTFVSGKSSSVNAEITDLKVTIISPSPRCGRVQCNVVFPVTLNYTDANNVEGSGQGLIEVPIDIVMNVPEASIMPYQIKAIASGVLTEGVYVGSSTTIPKTYTFNAKLCATLIMKVITIVDIIIPTYGYAVLPPCTDYAEEVCNGFFELPLFPSSQNQ